MIFQYAAPYLESEQPRPISLSLPLQAEPFDAAVSKSWFANLLPEGEIRGHVARKLGVSDRNEYAILEGIGGNCAGALRLLPESAPVTTEELLVPLPWEELEAKIAANPRPSLLALVLQEGELRLSLAGAQDKLPVLLQWRTGLAGRKCREHAPPENIERQLPGPGSERTLLPDSGSQGRSQYPSR